MDAESGRRWLARGGALLAAGAVGFFLGGGVSADAPRAPSAQQKAIAPSPASLRTTPLHLATVTRPEAEDAPAGDVLAQFKASIAAIRGMHGLRQTLALYEAAQKLTATNIPDALTSARRLPQREGLMVINAIVERWVELDPNAAATYALGGADRLIDRNLLQLVVESWSAENPEATLAWIDANVAGRERDQYLYRLTAILGRSDPQRALALLQESPGWRPDDRQVNNIYEEWAGRAPRAAAAAAMALPTGGNRTAALKSIAWTWADSDPAGALAWTAQIPELRTRADAEEQVIIKWGFVDAPAALRSLATMNDPLARDRLATSVLVGWASRDPGAARDHVLTLPLEKRGEAICTVARILGRYDAATAMALVQQLPLAEQAQAGRGVVRNYMLTNPQAAAELLLTLPPSIGPDHTINNVAATWARTDPAGSAKWLVALPPSESRSQSLNSVTSTWAEHNPASAGAWLLECDLGENGSQIAQTIATQWAGSDEDSALRWAEKLPDAQRVSAFNVICGTIAERDPARAVQLVSQLPTAEKAAAVSKIVQVWARREPAAAARWTSTLPEASRGPALQDLVSAWVEKDATAAAGWLQTLPAGNERATSRISLVFT